MVLKRGAMSGDVLDLPYLKGFKQVRNKKMIKG
jgi:hypothetical protein